MSPRNKAGGGTPRSVATEDNSFSPITPTSTPGPSVKPTFPRMSTAASTLTTSKNGMPKTPGEKSKIKMENNNVSYVKTIISIRNKKLVNFKLKLI